MMERVDILAAAFENLSKSAEIELLLTLNVTARLVKHMPPDR